MKEKHSCILLKHAAFQINAGMFFFIAILFLSFSATGQSYFYFENQIIKQSGDSISLYSFLTLNPDGSASLRTISKNHQLSVQNMADSVLVDNNSSGDYKYLVPVFDTSNNNSNKSPNYKIRFVFKKQVDSSNIYYIPFKTEYADKDGNWVEATTVLEQEKTYATLLQEERFVRSFFLVTDEFYKYLFGNDRTRAVNKPRKEKMFLMVVANTYDKTIGASSEKDFDDINGTFTTLAANLGMKLIATRINGINFNKKNVNNALLNLKKAKPSKDDIIIFYYSGHGFRYSDDVSPYPRMLLTLNEEPTLKDVAKNNVSVEDVYKQILKLGARVNIVLSDCCNEDIGAKSPVGRDILITRGGGYNTTSQSLNMENCNALFFSKEPVSIIASSTQEKQLASGNPVLGGFFTYFFNGLLEKSLYSFGKSDSWLQLFIKAKEKARWQALSAMCGSNRCVQLTEMDVNPKK